MGEQAGGEDVSVGAGRVAGTAGAGCSRAPHNVVLPSPGRPPAPRRRRPPAPPHMLQFMGLPKPRSQGHRRWPQPLLTLYL